MKKKAKAIAIVAARPSRAHSISVFFLTIAIYILLVSAAFAACNFASGTSAMASVLCEIMDFMYGNMGRGLATLAVLMIGVGALFGKTSWPMAVTVTIGISIMFNAETLTSLLLCGNASTVICL